MKYRNVVSLAALLILVGVIVFLVQIKMRNSVDVYTAADESSLINLKASESFVIKLEEDPASAFTWHYSIDNESVIVFESDTFEPLTIDSAVNDPGIRSFRFRALKAGTAAITFKSFKEWEKEDVSETYIFTFNVK